MVLPHATPMEQRTMIALTRWLLHRVFRPCVLSVVEHVGCLHGGSSGGSQCKDGHPGATREPTRPSFRLATATTGDTTTADNGGDWIGMDWIGLDWMALVAVAMCVRDHGFPSW